MHNLLHWGNQLNWTPIVYLGIASLALFSVRLLTIWFLKRIYTCELLVKMRSESVPEAESAELEAKLYSIISTRISKGKPMFPAFVSKLYKLSAAAFIIVTAWGLVSTAWWIFLLSLLTWYFIHLPFRDIMRSCSDIGKIWVSILTIASVSENVDALKKSGISSDQEKEIKNRLGI